MSNNNAPYGFRYTRSLSGSTPSVQLYPALILASYATPIFRGDVVVWNAGYVQLASPGTTTIAGIFDGCEWQSQSSKQPRFSNYWPGSDAPSGGSVKCQLIIDPFAVFQVQSDGTTAIGQAALDQNAQFVAGAGNTATGLSTMAISHTTATTATYPFRVVGINIIGSDVTSPFNSVEVTFNNAMLRAGTLAV